MSVRLRDAFGWALLGAIGLAAYTSIGAQDAARISATPGVVSVQGQSGLLGYKTGVNFNTTTDQAIDIWAARWVLRRVLVTNASASLTLAVGGIYTGAGKTGNVLVPATQPYTTLTAAGKHMDLTLATFATSDVVVSTTIYFSLTTAQGSATTADIYVYGDWLP